MSVNTFNVNANQQDTINDKSTEIFGIIVISGSTVVIGKSHSIEEDSIFIHTDDTLEPLYMGVQEARILASLLTLAVG